MVARTPKPDDGNPLLASIQELATDLRATQEALTDCLDVATARRNASHTDTSLPHPALRAVAEVALLLDMNRERLLHAVQTIPGKEQYAPYVDRLRAAAQGNPELKALVDQAPKVVVPLRDALPVLAQIADELQAGRDRLLEAGRGLRTHPDAGTQVEKTLLGLREIASQLAATVSPLTQSVAHLDAFIPTLSPLVDSLSDLSEKAGPLAERLKGSAAAAPAAVPPAGSSSGAAEWASDILRSVRDLAEAVKHQPPPAGADGKRLWDSVRQIQVEIVNLQGALLAPAKKDHAV
jgi:hypothetical protein